MDTLYNKIDKIVNEIRDVKDFIIFEGSKFINKIIKSSSDKDFINFLKLKLNPIAAIQDTTDKRSVFEKIFKKRPEIKSLGVNSVTPEIFNKIILAIEEWNNNKKTLSDEKFEIIKILIQKLNPIELKLINLYDESEKCDELKKQKKYWKLKSSNPNSEINPISKQETNPENAKEAEVTPTKVNEPQQKSNNTKPFPSVQSPEDIEKVYQEKANELLIEIISIINYSSKLTPDIKKIFEDKINEKQESLMLLLKEKIAYGEDKNFKDAIKQHIEDYDKSSNFYHVKEISKLLKISKRK
jgi:hypothetical protein